MHIPNICCTFAANFEVHYLVDHQSVNLLKIKDWIPFIQGKFIEKGLSISEEWSEYVNRQPAVDELPIDETELLVRITSIFR